jgi:hypothetical protein
MLQWLYTYVANVCCQFFICFFRRMLQECLSGRAYVPHICCRSSVQMLRILAMVSSVFSGVFVNVVYACFMCFVCLYTYVASRCFESTSGVAFSFSPSAASPQCHLLAFCCLASFSDCGGGADTSTCSPLLCCTGRAGIPLRCSVATSSLRSDSRWWAVMQAQGRWNHLTVGWWELHPNAS